MCSKMPFCTPLLYYAVICLFVARRLDCKILLEDCKPFSFDLSCQSPSATHRTAVDWMFLCCTILFKHCCALKHSGRNRVPPGYMFRSYSRFSSESNYPSSLTVAVLVNKDLNSKCLATTVVQMLNSATKCSTVPPVCTTNTERSC